MPKTEANEEYRARQFESIRQFALRPDLADEVKAFATANNMSVSEVLREAIETWTKGEVPPLRIRRTKRMSVWIAPDRFVAFQRKAAEEEIPQVDALEAALRVIL
jgi:hypothetical protein